MKKLLALLALLLAGPALAAPTPYPGIGQIFGVYTYATLPSVTTTAIGTFAYTSDDGYVYTNGVSWVIIGLSGGGSGTVTSVAATVPSFLSISGSPITTSGTLAFSLGSTPLPIANGGTGTATPGLVAGTNVTITGSWPDQTINSSGGGSGITALTGDVTASGTGSVAATVKGANGVLYSSLATGILKNTTSTGVPSAAAAADVVALFSTCSGTQYLGADGSCHTASGAGSVTSVAATVPSWLTVTGSPVTTSGTLAIAAAAAQTANEFVATPNGTTGAAALRTIVLADLPAIANGTLLGNGSGGSAVPAALATSGCLALGSTTASINAPINAQTGTTYTITTTDACKLVTFSNAAAIAVTLPVATTSGFGVNFSFDIANKGVGLVTLTPTTSTIAGESALTIPGGRSCTVTSDGTNYQISACEAAVGPTVDTFVVSGSGTSITPTCTVEDNYGTMTASGGTFTVNAPAGCSVTGGPFEGQKLLLHLKFTNSQTYSWNAIFAGGTTALPTTSTGTSKGDWVAFRYDSINSKWDYVATATGF